MKQYQDDFSRRDNSYKRQRLQEIKVDESDEEIDDLYEYIDYDRQLQEDE